MYYFLCNNLIVYGYCRPLDKNVRVKIISSYLLTKHMLRVVKKNRLIETVLLNTHNKCYRGWVRKYLQFSQIFFGLSAPLDCYGTIVTSLRDSDHLHNKHSHWNKGPNVH